MIAAPGRGGKSTRVEAFVDAVLALPRLVIPSVPGARRWPGFPGVLDLPLNLPTPLFEVRSRPLQARIA